ncbi:copia protein [Tanacetum coccineum]|uniref:Copia protein n=1 Tax=Tanacetum coccineum TaxID=301880 RepID=A0ABQ5FSL7_9ASTR
MWESTKTVAPTPNSVIVRPDVDDNFVINSTHLKMILENNFDGQLRANPHDHICEFLAICDMFKHSETQSEVVKLLMFPYSLSDKAKTWFNELNEESITLSDSVNLGNDKKTFHRSRDDKNGKSDRKCFRCGDPNHLIGECPKPPKDKKQRAFVGSSWSDSGEEDDEKVKGETCLVAHASSEICLGVDLEPDEWIKDNGCSKHITANRKLFSTYKAYNRGNVIFGSNLRGNIIGKVPQPRNMTIIGTKWVFRNKLDENGVVSQNKARLVAQGYNQQEGIDYDETYAPVARLESIRILLAYACALDFKLFQMDKQIALAISMIEAEYVSARKECQQTLWMKQALIDYDVQLDDVPIMCDNKGAIDLSKNLVQHPHTKHIEIRHHFLRDNVQKGHISIEKVSSVDNIADILTKPLKRESFNYLRLGLGMMEHIP